MSRATDANSYRVFRYKYREVHSIEMVRMLCMQNEALSKGEEYYGTRYLSVGVRNVLYNGGYIEPSATDGHYTLYRLTEEGVAEATKQKSDEGTMAAIQPYYHQFAIHPDTLRLRMLQGNPPKPSTKRKKK